jgi:hypothetical protein
MKYNKDYTKILDKLIINIETFFIFEASWHKIPNSEYSTWIGNTQKKMMYCQYTLQNVGKH